MITPFEQEVYGAIKGLVLAARKEGVGPDVAASIALADMLCRHLEQREQPDGMPAGWNRPAPASTDELLGVLHRAAEAVAIGDSFEGTISWTMPTDEPELEGAEFGLIARYRIGNLQGQGGLSVFTRP